MSIRLPHVDRFNLRVATGSVASLVKSAKGKYVEYSSYKHLEREYSYALWRIEDLEKQLSRIQDEP